MTTIEVRMADEYAGAAAFSWAAFMTALEVALQSVVGDAVELREVRFLDPKGREVPGPAPEGTTIVGFERSRPDGAVKPASAAKGGEGWL